MSPLEKRVVAIALVGATTLGCVVGRVQQPRTALEVEPPAVEPACPGAPAGEPAFSDAFAPVVVPGPDRPRALRTGHVDGIEKAFDVAPFKSPSRKHPDGTLALLAHTRSADAKRTEVVEVDLATRRPIRRTRMPDSYLGWVAATPDGVAAFVPVTNGCELVFLDPELRVRRTRRSEPCQDHGGLHAHGRVVAHAQGDAEALVVRTYDLATGAPLGTRKVRRHGSYLTGNWGHVVVTSDRVFVASYGQRETLVYALSHDLSHLHGKLNVPGFAPNHPIDIPHWATGILAPAFDAVVLFRDKQLQRLRKDASESWGELAIAEPFGHPPAVHSETGRVLFANGLSATRFGRPATRPIEAHRVVAFRSDPWRWEAEGPLRHDEPLAAFFMADKGVIVTRHPGVRVTILEWPEPKPEPEPARAESEQ